MKGTDVIRIIGVLLGVVSVLLLARSGLGIEFSDTFSFALNAIADWIAILLPLDVIERNVVFPALEYLRVFGIDVPRMQAHWRYVFVLLLLLLFATRRLTNTPTLTSTLALQTIGLVVALAIAVVAGTQPLTPENMVYWLLSGTMLYAGLSYLLLGNLLSASTLFAGAAATAAWQFMGGSQSILLGAVGSVGLGFLIFNQIRSLLGSRAEFAERIARMTSATRIALAYVGSWLRVFFQFFMSGLAFEVIMRLLGIGSYLDKITPLF